VAQVLLVVLALVLPFEVPLFHLGPLVITSVELLLYLVIAAWVAGCLVGIAGSGSRRAFGETLRGALGASHEPLVRAVALYLAVVVVSALAASEHRAPAVKFALRTLSGGILFFAVRDLVRSHALYRRVVLGLVLGAVISAVAALIESAVPASLPLWRWFRPTAFTTLGLPRASGTFVYPTVAAMYWEAALPLLVVLAEDERGSLRGVWRFIRGGAAIASAGLLVLAVLTTATRSALGGMIVAGGALLVLLWRRGRAVRRVALGIALVLVLFIGSVFGIERSSLLAQRLQWWEDGSWYRVRYEVGATPRTMIASTVVGVPLTLHNTGTVAWPAAGNHPVRLSYHWETSDARTFFEGRRTLLTKEVPAGSMTALVGMVDVPATPGWYRLRWDLVREGVTWFSHRGNPTGDQRVHVTTGVAVSDRAPAPPATPQRSVAQDPPTRSELWAVAVRLWRRHPLLGVGPDNYRHLFSNELAARSDGRRFNDERMHANSLYFETLADLGLAGLVALGLMMLALAATVRERATAGSVVALACSIGVTTFFVHGLFDYFFPFTSTFSLFWLLLAMTKPAQPSASQASSPGSSGSSPRARPP
jgi:O-antigen ligase